ncbi:MAG: manganese transporter [Gemmatimonadota bacterium]|nr:MAG: manganese transporter [Gemmatimonadota bacterium]
MLKRQACARSVRRLATVQGLVLAFALAAVGCGSDGEKGSTEGQPIRVTATVGMVADVVRNVGGDRVTVTALMGPGVDPHLYKASEGDIARLADADIVFYNGLLLEGKMTEVLEKIAQRGRTTVAVAERIDATKLLHPKEFEGHPDPHVWFDVSMWKQTIAPVVEALAAVEPESREQFQANAARFGAELDALHAWCGEQLALVPEEGRVLVTAHDAFGYFGRAYGVEVVGLQGLSTASEYGLKDVRRIVDLVSERRVKAVFVESSVPKRSIEAVVEGCRANGHDVRIGGELFSDAMGEAGTPEGTYVGMVRANVTKIVEALR